MKRLANALVVPAVFIIVWFAVALAHGTKDWLIEVVGWAATMSAGVLYVVAAKTAARFLPQRWPKHIRWIIEYVASLAVLASSAWVVYHAFSPVRGGLIFLGSLCGASFARDLWFSTAPGTSAGSSGSIRA